MSKKYVVDLPGDAQYILINGASENHCYTRVEQVDDLEELNSDYINEHYGELQDEAFDAGLNKAWEAAQKVVCKTEVGGMTLDTLKEVFGVLSPAAIMQLNTAQEAIDKIKAYEHKDSDRIEVGDEVIDKDGNTTIVTNIHERLFDGLCSDGSTMSDLFLEDVRKTGRHYDHIGKLLEAIRA